ncbi:hypothetical protein AARI_06500 [Glutamicibacter arilaitensis Re117]|uniref:Uncharacterized protein n=1 Tax=Glutamicibacter arilaitensis (strain DSM 16368 / CIP 108037 / IAM 15318 / JCM 13566 / NCIMB 14258 / Re117) TaxID=861360 RepID=A0ABM9PUG9_GLUAR|nr:hypothetical protein AARI_06500 [Glutamicibacter arilaitensis Re117]
MPWDDVVTLIMPWRTDISAWRSGGRETELAVTPALRMPDARRSDAQTRG